MDIPILWIALIAGIICTLVGVIYWGETQKKGKRIRNIFMFLGIAGLVCAGLAFGNVIPQTYTTQVTIGGVTYAVTPPSTNQVDQICAVEDTSVTLYGVDNYLATASGGSHRYKVNGNIATVTSDAVVFTASPGNTIEVLWMNGSTTGYFSKVRTYTVPCKGTFLITEKLSKNGTLTSRIFNTNSVLIDGTTNQSVTIGDIKSLKLELEQAYQKDIPYGAVVVVEYNKSTMTNVILQANGVELPSASVPHDYVISYSVNSVTKAYLMPELLSNEVYTYTVVLDASSAGAEPVGTGSDVLLNYFHRNDFINEKNGGAFEGPSAEDEYNVATRTGQDLTTVHIN